MLQDYAKGFYSYINERRIIRDNVGPLKTPTLLLLLLLLKRLSMQGQEKEIDTLSV